MWKRPKIYSHLKIFREINLKFNQKFKCKSKSWFHGIFVEKSWDKIPSFSLHKENNYNCCSVNCNCNHILCSPCNFWKISWKWLIYQQISFYTMFAFAFSRSFRHVLIFTHCGNYGILLSRFYCKKSLKSMFYERNFTLNWFDGKNLHGSEFLVFPHCDICNTCKTWKEFFSP